MMFKSLFLIEPDQHFTLVGDEQPWRATPSRQSSLLWPCPHYAK